MLHAATLRGSARRRTADARFRRRRDDAVALSPKLAASLVWREAAEQPVTLAIWSSREVERVSVSAVTPVTEPDGPQAVNYDRLAMGIPHLVDEFAGSGVERIDM